MSTEVAPKKNSTIWPESIVGGKGRAWVPIPVLMMRHWHRLGGLNLSCFAVLVWAARWIYSNGTGGLSSVKVAASGIAKEAGVGHSAISKSFKKLHNAGLLRVTNLGKGRPLQVDFTPLVRKLQEAEAAAAKEHAEPARRARLIAGGSHLCDCGRYACHGCGRPVTEPIRGFGHVDYSDLGVIDHRASDRSDTYFEEVDVA
jgi:hypothetical protein